MNKKNKTMKIMIASSLLLFPAITFAWEDNVVNSWKNSWVHQEKKADYYNIFKQEFSHQLWKWDFSIIDEKIKWYQADIDYLSKNPESEHYKNISLYQEKVTALEMLKKNFWNSIQKLDHWEHKKIIEEFKKSLEESIKNLRDTITSENREEIKSKAEIIKQEYIKKAQDLWLDKYKQIVEERFQTFYQNNFTKNEEIKKIIDEKKVLLEKAKKEMNEKIDITKNKLKEKHQELKEIKKEDIQRIVNEKKEDFNKIKETFAIKKQDLKLKYKEIFSKQLEWKLDKFSEDKLQSIMKKIDWSIEKYTSNEKLSSEQKEKFIAQLIALKELVQEKILQTHEMINIDELIGE